VVFMAATVAICPALRLRCIASKDWLGEEIWLVSRIFASAWSVPCSNPSPENSFIRR